MHIFKYIYIVVCFRTANVDPTGWLAMVGSIRQVDLTKTMRVTRDSGAAAASAAVAQNDGRRAGST